MASRAWLYLVGAPHGARVSGLDGDGGTPVVDGMIIGRIPGSEIVVSQPMIGGRRNSRVSERDGRWVYDHLGHGITCFHNERALRGGDAPAWLSDGDVFGPHVAQTGFGERLTFVLVEHASGSLRGEVLPAVEDAIRAAFPDDAPARIADVRRWFASEPLASEAALARVLHCELCTRFTQRDVVVEVEAHPSQYQVIADFQVRIGDAVEYPAMAFCEGCLAEPAATFERAANADRFRVDLQRVLDAAQLAESPAATEIERRRAAAQSALAIARCVLCMRESSCLSGRAKRPVCADCLRRASAVRHIRG